MKRALVGLLLAGLVVGFVPHAAAAADPCIPVDLDGDGTVDSPPEPDSGCIIISMVIEPKKPQPVVDLGFHTVHAGLMWTPQFDPIRIVDSSLTFGNPEDPTHRANPPVTSRCKFEQLNGDGHLDKICKWDTVATDLHPGDTSACLSGWTSDMPKVYVEACAPLTTINGGETPTFRIDDVSIAEGNSGAMPLQFTVTLAPAAQGPVSVSYYTSDEAAVSPSDYQATSGSLQFAAGETSKTLTVNIVGDLILEPDEAFSVYLSSPTGGTVIGDMRGSGVILNDDSGSTPVLSIADASVTEGNSGTTPAVFTVILSPPSTTVVGVSWETLDGTAAEPDDYVTASGSLSFAPGETSKTLSVDVVGDTEIEPNESFSVQLSSPSGAAIGDGTGLGTIQTDDVASVLSINDATVTEGNSGTTLAIFTVTLSPASSDAVSVDWATSDGSAASPGDYIGASDSLSFSPGETTKTVSVAVVGDTAVEPQENFFVNLSNAGVALGDGQGVGTINDDDAPPSVSMSIADFTITEGTGGTKNAVLTVTLSAPSSQQVTVAYQTMNGTAVAPGDYTSTSGTLTFAPGQTSKTIVVAIVGDAVKETSESFTVELSNPTNATILDGSGRCVIRDND